MRPRLLDAMQFDGTAPASNEAVVAPGIPIRPRTEYRGWNDRTGYLELEARDFEHGCMADDWIVVSEAEGRHRPWFVADQTFHKYYEALPSKTE